MSGRKEKIFDGNGEATSGWEKSEEKINKNKGSMSGNTCTSCKEIY